MNQQQIILWLPWDAASLNHEAAAYQWVSQFNALLGLAINNRSIVINIDGAAALIAEFIPSHAGAMEQAQALSASGQLWMGPWFARPSATLASGETLIRNLLLGSSLAKQFSAVTRACFLFPAPIYISQMPQLLAGFGIEAVAFPQPPELWHSSPHTSGTWQSADGSSVKVIALPITALEHLMQNADAPAYAGAGIIHAEALLRCLNNVPLTELLKSHRLVSLESIGSSHPASQCVIGELINIDQESNVTSQQPRMSQTLATPAYGSAWPHLRSAVSEAEALLTYWAEPWATAAWLQGHDYPQHYLAKAWQHILLNHRRDAVGGCNNDASHRHMLVRAERSLHLAETICRAGMAAVAKGSKYSKTNALAQLWVANPAGWTRSEIVSAQLMMPPDTQHLELSTDAGQLVPYQLHHVELTRGPHIEDQAKRFSISFRAADIPSTGFRRLLAKKAQQRPYFMGESIAAGNTLENKLLRVTVKPSGALRIEDKRNGCVYDNCNVFEDGGDAGSFTNFAPPQQDRLITTYATHAHVSIVENGVLVGAIQVQHELSLPAELHPYRDRRSDQRVTCDVTSLVTLRQGSDRVEIHTKVVNRAQDHRLRVLFTTGIPAITCHVAQPFDVVERATGMINSGEVTSERGALPKLEFVDISDDRHGLMVACNGVYEYEVKPTPAGTIALTLLRAVSAPNGINSSGTNSIDAQALDSLEFSYALIPHSGSWESGLRSAWDFCRPLRTFTHLDLAAEPNQAGPPSYSIVSVEPFPVILSAVKRSEDGKALIVRIFNPTDRAVHARITTAQPPTAAWLARADETPFEALPCLGNAHLLTPCGAHKIVTLRLQFG